MLSNKSVGVWCVLRSGANSSTFEAHFNYWRIAGDEDFRRRARDLVKDFIEVGVLLEGA